MRIKLIMKLNNFRQKGSQNYFMFNDFQSKALLIIRPLQDIWQDILFLLHKSFP